MKTTAMKMIKMYIYTLRSPKGLIMYIIAKKKIMVLLLTSNYVRSTKSYFTHVKYISIQYILDIFFLSKNCYSLTS